MADFTFGELSPPDFLRRSSEVYADHTAIVDGDRRFTYREFGSRSLRLTGVLAGAGVQPGDRVAALCANSHVMLELHHAVPMRGAVLVPLNTRLSEPELTYILEHSGSSVLVATPELADTAAKVCAPLGIRVIGSGPDGEYERLLQPAEPRPVSCTDERGLLGINYTSGTTGRSKGVMTHHRGAYLQSLAVVVSARLDSHSSYLWTLPMFHCNGWCITWALTAVGGTHVCLRSMDPPTIWHLLRTEPITHLSAAPTVLTMIAEAPQADPPLAERISVQTGGSPPSPALLGRLDRLGMDVTHLYGLTETFGPFAVNEWQAPWDSLDEEEQASLRARQGVGNVITEPLRVVTAEGVDVARDGEAIGEIVARGNNVMLGYYRDQEATGEVTVDGWLRTGDLAVHHPDGYVEIRDRAKDIIISGGENIASVEVERAIDSHPDVVESAVVGVPDDRWGEVPVAFVTLRPGADVSGEAIVEYVRRALAGFKVPRRVRFLDLPKTSTGKIQKQALRADAAAEEAPG